ncbi:MAG: CbtA family protein [Thermoproteota archaeon]|nr:CbtA family protein [Thermoproteota archaeon]
MKTITFIAITLIAGAIAGLLLAVLNQGIVEPYIDQAINIENQNAMAQGEVINPQEFNNYRLWQKTGEITAGMTLGVSLGALFGVVFAYARNSIPGSNNKKKALILAGIMLIVIYIIPALKYPANPPSVGDPETIYHRESLYITILTVSGFSALGLAFLYRKLEDKKAKQVLVPLIFIAIIGTAFMILPPNPDENTSPMDLVMGFRIGSALTMSVFWGLLGLILGTLWDKTKPDETARIATV